MITGNHKAFDLSTEVLVVGGGGAGFRAAISAVERGAGVILLSKGPLARSGASPMAGADFTLDGRSMSEIEGLTGDPNDTPEKVYNDIVTQGWHLNNRRLVDQYIAAAPVCLKELIEWGIDIKTSDQRMIFTSGTKIMDVLLKRARRLGVRLIENVALLALIVEDGRVVGGVALDIMTGDFLRIRARSVVMATGGWHKAFEPTTGMRDLSGEGIAIAHRAGADIGNMEFITFCCNVFYDPPMWRGSIAPYMLSLISGGRLTNNRGEDILAGYDPDVVRIGTTTEWNKSFLSQVSAKEAAAGRGFKNGGVHYSRGDVPWDFMKMIGGFVFPNWKYKALDLTRWALMLEQNEPVEVGPAVEYFDGGIVVNERFETSVQGLFAAGECCLGAFGANRVFSAITEMLVQGRDAGRNAADYAAKTADSKPPTAAFARHESGISAPLERETGQSPGALRRRVQEAAHRHLGPIRTEKELRDFIALLEGIKKDELPGLAVTGKTRAYNKEWLDALELPHIVHLLLAAAMSALARTESRGVHFRQDYPKTDNDAWLKESIVTFREGVLAVTTRPVTAGADTLPAGNADYLDMMKRLMLSHSDTGGKH
jgi:succinate dehydrogenase/fumarate reductase flavoprotein subunit